MKMVTTSVSVVLALLPTLLQAQPAPIRNPVVERAPCNGAARAHAGDTYTAGLAPARYTMRTERYGVDTRRYPVRHMVVPAASVTDVRRDIVLELSRDCR